MLAAVLILPAVQALHGRTNSPGDHWVSANGNDCGSCMWNPACRRSAPTPAARASADGWCRQQWAWNNCKHTCCKHGRYRPGASAADVDEKANLPVAVAGEGEERYAVPTVAGDVWHGAYGTCGTCIYNPTCRKGLSALAWCNQNWAWNCRHTCCHGPIRVEADIKANLPAWQAMEEGDETAVKEFMSADEAPRTSSAGFFFFALGAVAMFVVGMTYVHLKSRTTAAPEAASEKSYGAA